MKRVKVEALYSSSPVEYSAAMLFMLERVNLISSKAAHSAIWFLEHPSLYTCGRSAIDSDIKNTLEFPLYQTDRGGRITYHGPGQRIVYIMLDLREIYKGIFDIRLFIKDIMQWVVNSISTLGINIKALYEKDKIGIWMITKKATYKKIVSIGLKIKKMISYHGIAINISPNTNYFSDISPCGLDCSEISAINTELQESNYILQSKIDIAMKKEFSRVFMADLELTKNIIL